MSEAKLSNRPTFFITKKSGITAAMGGIILIVKTKNDKLSPPVLNLEKLYAMKTLRNTVKIVDIPAVITLLTIGSNAPPYLVGWKNNMKLSKIGCSGKKSGG